MNLQKSILLSMALAILIAPAGCIFSPDDDDPSDGPPPAAGLPFPGSKDQLIANFRQIYEDMDALEYKDVIHRDYKTKLQASTVEEFGLPVAFFTYEDEVRIHQRMFSGDALTDPDGNAVPGVTSVEFSQFVQQDAWAVAPPNDPDFPNAEWAIFNSEFQFTRTGYTTLVVRGPIKVYVTSRDSLHEGSSRPYYQMIGQVDLTDSN